MKNNAIILQNNKKSVNERSHLMDQMKYLKELAVRYPNVAAASTEITLQILHLPKGTEHYVSDVHGEYEKFSHIIRKWIRSDPGSRIEDEFGNTLTTKQRKNLASVIYYPEQKMDLMEEELLKNFFLNGSMIRWYVWFMLQDQSEINIQDQSKESNVTRICLCDGRIDGRTPES